MPPGAVPLVALPPLSDGERLALDDAAVLDPCTRWSKGEGGSKIAESRFSVSGLQCAACAGLIEQATRGVAGIFQAEVNAASRTLRVTWDGAPGRIPGLVAAVRRAGYGVQPLAGQGERDQRRIEGRRMLWRLFVAGFCMMQVMMLTTPAYLAKPGDIPPDLLALMRWATWVLSVPVMVFSSTPFLAGAWRGLRQRRIGMDVPVALGIVITFVAGTVSTFDPGGPFGHEAYLDSLTMFITFLLAGRWLEWRARERCTQALDELLQRLPESVQRVSATGELTLVPVARLRCGDRVQVALGQAFPGDGVLLDADTQVDEALLSGESRPVWKRPGDVVAAGTVNMGAVVRVRLDAVGDDTRYGEIVDLVQGALSERPHALRVADRWAGPFLWAVLVLAASGAAAWSVIDPARSLWVAVSVLIVTCPCALSLAAPTALLSAAAALARRGVLVRHVRAIETLAHVDVACFDKTGTLTQEHLSLVHMDLPSGANREWLLAHAALLARRSAHPVSRALAEALAGVADAEPDAGTSVVEYPGRGIEARDARGQVWRLGSTAWTGVVPAADDGRVQVGCRCMSGGARLQARFEFDEVLRAEALPMAADLRAEGVGLCVLSGDAPERVQAVARRLGIDEARGGASPEDKLAFMRAAQARGRTVLMVGDGVNDGPVLARADVSMALAHGSALAQQRADFIILGSRLGEVAAARRLAVRTLRVVRQNLAWSVVYNLTCVPLALVGWLPPWAAGAGMALSSLAVVANALRLTR